MSIFLPHLVVDGKGNLPILTSPIVAMQLAEFFQDGRRVLLGPHLMTPSEIDEQVDRVISDAEAFRRLAKHELDLAQTRARRP
jgi:hypothetical protein